MKPEQRERIEQHGRNLLAIFTNATEKDPVKLCKRLRALERRAGAVALRLCNGPEYSGGEDAVDKITNAILAKVNSLLGNETVPVFINRDPRGYALKIRDRWMTEHKAVLHKDWGGYGILAPEID